MEQGLYTKVVTILQKESENKTKKENTKKYNFQGKSARSRCWFSLDHEWLEENFMTYEPYFYRKIIKMFRGDDTKTYQLFALPIGNSKITNEMQFHPAAPVIKYHQNSSNICCFSSLASVFQSIGDYRDVTALVNLI